EEGAHEKSPKCLGGNLGDFWGGFCKGLRPSENIFSDGL
ncbi:MAG: NAD(P)H-flavin oxidoreductase, partial [Neisseria sp.]